MHFPYWPIGHEKTSGITGSEVVLLSLCSGFWGLSVGGCYSNSGGSNEHGMESELEGGMIYESMWMRDLMK